MKRLSGNESNHFSLFFSYCENITRETDASSFSFPIHVAKWTAKYLQIIRWPIVCVVPPSKCVRVYLYVRFLWRGKRTSPSNRPEDGISCFWFQKNRNLSHALTPTHVCTTGVILASSQTSCMFFMLLYTHWLSVCFLVLDLCSLFFKSSSEFWEKEISMSLSPAADSIVSFGREFHSDPLLCCCCVCGQKRLRSVAIFF